MREKQTSGIRLKEGERYYLPIKNGYLEILVSPDTNYPGMDIEYISDREDEVATDKLRTRPRVVVECNKNKLRALIWGNPDMEDYSGKIEFSCVDDSKE